MRLVTLNLLHGGLTDGDGNPEDRWPGQANLLRRLDPDMVCIQEAHGWLANRRSQQADAEADLGMRVHLTPGPVTGTATAVAHRHSLRWRLHDDAHASRIHGYTHVVLDTDAGPLSVISGHLTPYSAAGAAIEAQTLAARLYRHSKLGILAGDINHTPFDGDGGLDWSTVQPYNRSSRTTGTPETGLVPDRQVAEVFARADLTDVALHLRTGVVPTGKGGLRVDQAHVTRPLLPAVVDLNVVDTGDLSDHQAVVVDLDLARLA